MNSKDVTTILDIIANTGSRSEKETTLQAHIHDPLMRKVVRLAYDSFITFGLVPKKPTRLGTAVFEHDDPVVWPILEELAKRNVTGNRAIDTVNDLFALFEASSAELLWRILMKDLRCGITEKTVNKVLPGTIPTFDVMLAHKFEEKRIKQWPVAVEPKLDGVRVICLVKDGVAKFFSRTGKPFPAVEHLGEQVSKMVADATIDIVNDKEMDDKLKAIYAYMLGSGTHSMALDGEIVSGSFNKTVGDVRRKDAAATDAEYHLFDVVPYWVFTGPEREFEFSFRMRRHFLRYLVDRTPSRAIRKTPCHLANSVDEVQTWYQTFRDQGLEGAIVKPLDGTYAKKRSHAWLKMKNEASEDLRVIGAFEGTGKYAGMLGGLIVDREGVEVRVGGGFSDQQRQEFWEAYLADAGPIHTPEYENQLIGRLIEVEYHEVTPDGSLRHPRFIRFRDDKDPALSIKEAAE